MNLYKYCKNNPINYIDPSGNIWWWVAPALTGAASGGLGYIGGVILTGGSWSWIDFGLSIAGGAMSGVILPLSAVEALKHAGAALVGGGTGLVQYVISQKSKGKCVTIGGAIANTIAGAMGGAIGGPSYIPVVQGFARAVMGGVIGPAIVTSIENTAERIVEAGAQFIGNFEQGIYQATSFVY